MNKTQLIDFIAERVGLSKVQARIALEAILNIVMNTLKEGDQVQMIGFGTFKVNYRASRVGRNPKTGDQIQIAPLNVPTFVPSKTLKSLVK
ncbi:DNA-binding protein HU-alpha [Candidatus Photodesmus blepharus]|uniref:DNA-binding protein HU-alpha n=2 Tax=Candidatus Photodesmus blepharonis TaxID=1179155 RepID=A0A084CND9_9GAMM|nr:DNA-binding protein HU-alpha [Candidatus Photodesmus blepharus]